METTALNNSYPVLKRFCIFLVAPIMIALGAGFYYFHGSLPENTVTLSMRGLSAPVRITRDSQGVPLISAKSDHDVFFAMGYVHAQDRLWQLEVQRRIAQGRLAEIFGSEAVPRDIWMRTLGLYDAAKLAWPALSDEAKDSLTAYSDGINAWEDTHATLPPEFAMLGVTPAKWTPIDSLAWVKVFSLNLSGNINTKIEHYLAAQSLTPKELSTFFYDKSGKDGGPAPAVEVARNDNLLGLMNLQKSMEENLQIGGRFVGSNAWVVSGKLTKDGGALLANDPHLGLQIPSLWYPVVQKGNRLASTGMSLVGLPVVVFGQNGRIAWGGTSMMADVQDLYLEQINTSDPTQYRVNDGWEHFVTRIETIDVKPDFPASLRKPLDPVKLEVRTTRHGPIISDVISQLKQPVSLRWVGLDANDTTYEAFFHLNYANDWNGFNDALKLYQSPALNLLYADKKGNIGYLGAGRIPVRAAGVGALPVSGWNDEFAWTGYIPFDSLPRSYNPEKGYIASANNNMAGPNYPYFISNDWAPPGRVERISQLIELRKSAHGTFTASDAQGMQLDTVSLPALKMLDVLRSFHTQNERQQRALDYLKSWHGEMAVDSQSATIFSAWMRQLSFALFSARLDLSWNKRDQSPFVNSLIESVSIDDLAKVLNDKEEIWCNRAQVTGEQSCNRILSQSLDAALDEIQKLDGSDMDAWKWGKVHFTVYQHSPFSHVKLLDSIFEKRVGSGGSTDTINVANASLKLSDGYLQTFGAGFRQVIQFGSKENLHLYMNSTGQSGNIFSSHYSDMAKPFQKGEYFEFPHNNVDEKEPDLISAISKPIERNVSQ